MKSSHYGNEGERREFNAFRLDYEKDHFSLELGYLPPGEQEVSIIDVITMNAREMEALIVGMVSCAASYQQEYGGFNLLNVSIEKKEEL